MAKDNGIMLAAIAVGAYFLFSRIARGTTGTGLPAVAPVVDANTIDFGNPGPGDASGWSAGASAGAPDVSVAVSDGSTDVIDFGNGDAADPSVDAVDQPDVSSSSNSTGWVASIENFLGVSTNMNTWSPSIIPAQYAGLISDAENKYGIPRYMLARLLWQESHYRQDIITGTTKSRVGALGIAQFMPATAAELGVDPLDPPSAIDGAGRYLRRMYDATGTWADALAAYNWGLGNLRKKGIQNAPSETVAYYSGILGDIGMTTGTA